MSYEIQEYCKEKFKKLDELQADHISVSKDVEVLKTKMENLTDSIKGLTKALWGVTGGIMATLIGFVIWYIQNIK